MYKVIKFNGHDLLATPSNDGNHMVAIKPICDAIGINHSNQQRKIESDPKFSWSHMTSTGLAGRTLNQYKHKH